MDIMRVPLEGLECRDERCHWVRNRRHDESAGPMWGTYRYDDCTNCGSWRRRIEASDGRITPNTTVYEYSDAYYKAMQFSREDARLELNRRAASSSRHLRSVG